MGDKPFMHGPRDMGPADPPPWPELVIAGMGIVLMFVAGGIGLSYEWIGDVYVKGPCAFLCIIGLMIALALVGDGFDKARAAGDFDQQ